MRTETEKRCGNGEDHAQGANIMLLEQITESKVE